MENTTRTLGTIMTQGNIGNTTEDWSEGYSCGYDPLFVELVSSNFYKYLPDLTNWRNFDYNLGMEIIDLTFAQVKLIRTRQFSVLRQRRPSTSSRAA